MQCTMGVHPKMTSVASFERSRCSSNTPAPAVANSTPGTDAGSSGLASCSSSTPTCRPSSPTYARYRKRKCATRLAPRGASHRQRSDVLQEWYYAVRDFRTWVDRQTADLTAALHRIFDQQEWVFLVIDHTAVPLTLLPLRSPAIPVTQHTPLC